MADDCIFCKIIRKEIPVQIVYESESFIAFPDAHPKTKGHTLIIPKKHYANIIDMPDSLGSELLEAIKKVAAKRFSEGAEGFNLIVNTGKAAGQAVMHAHVHIIPRKSGKSVSFPCDV